MGDEIGGQSHMTIIERQLKRIADSLEGSAKCPVKEMGKEVDETRKSQFENDRLVKRIIENSVEIASTCLIPLQTYVETTHAGIGRNVVISRYIIPWAEEAEKEYQKATCGDEEDEVPYYDFIDEFAARAFEKETGEKLESYCGTRLTCEELKNAKCYLYKKYHPQRASDRCRTIMLAEGEPIGTVLDKAMTDIFNELHDGDGENGGEGSLWRCAREIYDFLRSGTHYSYADCEWWIESSLRDDIERTWTFQCSAVINAPVTVSAVLRERAKEKAEDVAAKMAGSMKDYFGKPGVMGWHYDGNFTCLEKPDNKQEE